MTSDVDIDDATSTPSRSTRRRAVDAIDTGIDEATPTSRPHQDYRRLSRDRRQAARTAARLREPEKARTKKLDRQGKWRDGWGEYCTEPGPGDIVLDPAPLDDEPTETRRTRSTSRQPSTGRGAARATSRGRTDSVAAGRSGSQNPARAAATQAPATAERQQQQAAARRGTSSPLVETTAQSVARDGASPLARYGGGTTRAREANSTQANLDVTTMRAASAGSPTTIDSFTVVDQTSLSFSVTESRAPSHGAESFSVDKSDSSEDENDESVARQRRVDIKQLEEKLEAMTLDRDLTVKNLEQTRKGLADQHVTMIDQDEKIEALETANARLKIESLNAQELISQLTDGKAAQADPTGDNGNDDPCRRPKCVELAVEYEEARNRFQQTVQKLTSKLANAESVSHAESVRVGELANQIKTVEAENKDLQEKLRFEEDRLEAANRRVNEANERADSVEHQLQEEIDQLEEELSEAKKKNESREPEGQKVEDLENENAKLKKTIENLKRELQGAKEEQQSSGGESDSESNFSARSQSRKRSSKRSNFFESVFECF